MATISIIIPIYNTEQYLKNCLDSVVNQDFADFEVILVDDGSTDASSAIACLYASKYDFIKFFKKENGGVSSARNLGLLYAEGEWITFVDSDDFIESNYLSCLYTEISDCDFVIQSLYKTYTKNSLTQKVYLFENQLLDMNEYISRFNILNYGYAVGKIYKRDIINTNHIRFDQKISFFEDCLFYLQYLKYCKNIKLSSSNNYIYRCDDNEKSPLKLPFDKYYYTYQQLVKSLISLAMLNKLDYKNLSDNLSYYTRTLLLILYKSNFNAKQRQKLLSEILANYEDNILSLFYKSKFRGRVITFLIRKKKVTFLDWFFCNFN